MKQKEEYKWLKEANSQSLQQALMDLDKAFKAFFKGISKYPNYKKKTNKQSFRIPQFFNFFSVVHCDGDEVLACRCLCYC